MLKPGKVLLGAALGAVGAVIAFTACAAALAELTRRQLPFGGGQVEAWMLGTPQPVSGALSANGTMPAGFGVGWTGYTHPFDPGPPRGIPFEHTPALNCLFRDPHYPAHTGVDFPEETGTPVTATQSGKVVWAGPNGPWGNLVVVENGGYQTYYAHLDTLAAARGQILSAGAVVGTTGSTGRSTGPHLHYGIKARHPGGGAHWRDPRATFAGTRYHKVPCPR
jgi:murein DD-endopeptidase MepM/ murein hydrolase activator NlpD